MLSPASVVAAFRLDLLLKIALSVVLGGAIGLEREVSGKPAGLRTNILICLGAAVLGDLSIHMGDVDGVRTGDPARLAAQVISGIGFLGAGTIMQARGTVTGLTTAATIWVVAAIGLTLGAGHFYEAVGAALIVTVVLYGLGNVEHKLRRARRVMSATIRARPGVSFDAVDRLLNSAGIRVHEKEIYDHPDDRTFELKLAGPARQYDVAQQALMQHPDVFSATFE
ncbi:MAG: MgtC/SapB family protein [Gemmatimonadaceae bacterium]